MLDRKLMQKLALVVAASYGVVMLGCGGNLPKLAGNNILSAQTAGGSSIGGGGTASATATPSPSPSPSPVASASPSPSATPTPPASPVQSPSPSPTPVADSGSGGGNHGGGNGGGGNGSGGNSGGGGDNGSGGGNGGNGSGGSGSGGNGGNGGGGNDGGGGNGGGGNGGHGGHGGGGDDDAGANGGERKPASLKTAIIPGPTAAELNSILLDKNAAIALGKAFFWEMQFGSDGMTACATCHSTAGSDNRFINQINPGFRRVDANGFPAADANTFYAPFGPNYTLTAADFPVGNSNIVGSQGVYKNQFNDVILGQAAEDQTPIPDEVFQILAADGTLVNTRRSTPRNAPSVINAVFNYRNFWDGRAQSSFNGVNPFGAGDPNAFLLQADSSAPNGFSQVKLLLSQSALASQAVGPPGSDVEMSASGRTFVKMGKKMLSLSPLAKQLVAPDDSVLGPLSSAPNNGLNTTYVAMIQAAFQPRWWNSGAVVDAGGNFLHSGTPQNTGEYSLMEFNFSMFWGVAIQMYESTLVADNSRFDQYMDGDRTALTALEQRGLDRFNGKGNCSHCHSGAELTDASVSNILSHGVVEQLANGAWHDVGFHNIGVRPGTDDQGIAAADPSGLPSLSMAAMASQGVVTDQPMSAGAAVSVNGAVKTPSLRNIELTGPYFLNGGKATLAQVVDFYSRGGDFPSTDVDPGLERISFSADDKAAVVAFLLSLTDERVRSQSAPFDHPSLVVPNGMAVDINGMPVEQTISIPATGASGGAPLPKFCQNIGAACD
jgi:cytochrome c peroxidase